MMTVVADTIEHEDSNDSAGTRFAMTDLQKAYYRGALPGIPLGGAPTRSLGEMLCEHYDHQRFQNAVDVLIARHTALRCCTDDGVSMVISQEVSTDIALKDATTLSRKDRAAFVEAERERFFGQPFDVRRPPLLHFEAVLMGEGRAHVFVCAHGMVMDGWSFEILRRELTVLYHGEKLPPVQGFDRFAQAAARITDDNNTQAGLEFWRSTVQTLPPPIEIPLLRDPNSIRQTTTYVVEQRIDTRDMASVEAFARAHKITPFAVLLTAFCEALGRYSDSREFLLSIPYSRRPFLLTKDSFGLGLCSDFFLFDYARPAGLSLAEKAQRVANHLTELFDHLEVSGIEMLRLLRQEQGRDAGAPVTFTALLDRQSGLDAKASSQGDFALQALRTHTSQVWLEAIVYATDDGARLLLSCVQGLIDPELAHAVGTSFTASLRALGEAASTWERDCALPLPAAHASIIAALNDTARPLPPVSLGELLELSFERYAHRLAVGTSTQELTYAQLRNRVDHIAWRLEDASSSLPTTEDTKIAAPVGILLGKGWQQIASALACLAKGEPFMPIEHELPPASILHCLRNAAARIVITSSELADRLPQDGSIIPIVLTTPHADAEVRRHSFAKSNPDSLCAFINTSGTTGQPKSIMLRQAGILNCLLASVTTFDLSDDERVISVTNFCHDMALFDTLGLFLRGGAVVLPDEHQSKEPRHWLKLMQRYDVSLWNSVPALLEMLLLHLRQVNEPERLTLRRVLLGGDWIQPSLVSALWSLCPDTRVFSVGGPSETTIWNISHEMNKKDLKVGLVPYGRPFPNTRYLILDEDGCLCPLGVTGTMYVAGLGVAAGYAGMPDETQRRFTLHDDEPLFNTGDLGRYLPDGTIQILGRKDFQIKLQGKRIELTGIETLLISLGLTESAAVVLCGNNPGRLVAFYTAKTELDTQQTRRELAVHLADYMIPSLFVRLDALPLTRNGKVDRRSLETWNLSSQAETLHCETKELSLTQKKLIQIFCGVLNEDGGLPSNEFNFYVLGGDSLLAMRVVTEIWEAFGIELSVYDILNTPDIRDWDTLLQTALDTAPIQESGDIESQKLAALIQILTSAPLPGLMQNGLRNGASVVSTDDLDFLEMGGDLADAEVLASQINSRFSIDITAFDLLGSPQLSDWVGFIPNSAFAPQETTRNKVTFD
jgi:amino acid adenylation domain-containing protein